MNKEGYRDPTAEKAVHNASKIPRRIREVMDAMNRIASLHGLEIVVVRDKYTGREWGDNNGNDKRATGTVPKQHRRDKGTYT